MRRVSPDKTEFSRHLSHEMTDAEQWLWRHLRMRQVGGVKFRRQHPLGPYVLDFACLEKQLAIELDGSQHIEQTAKDEARTEWLKTQGWQVLRFWDNEVLTNIDGVLSCVDAALHAVPEQHSWVEPHRSDLEQVK